MQNNDYKNNNQSKILVVDDEILNVKLISGILSHDYDIITASGGKEALEKVSSDRPDIVLLDIMMPDMNGYEVCNKIKQNEITRFIPVVMITALSDNDDKIRAMEVGADDFLTKPINCIEIITRVKSLLRVKHFHDRLIESREKIAQQNEALKMAHDDLENRVKERTEQLVKTNEALECSNKFSKTVLDSMNDAISIIDVNDLRIVGVNNVLLKQLGIREGDALGKKCYELTHNRSDPCKAPDDICPVYETLEHKRNSTSEHIHYTNGKKTYVEVSTSPILDANGCIMQVVHVCRDITERKTSEENLREANIRLKKADEIKTQFLSVVSHEMKTPLTPIKAQLQMMLAGYFGEVTEKQKKSLEMIMRNTIRQDRLVGDILDISKLEAGEMKFIMARHSINEVVSLAVESMMSFARGKNIELTFRQDIISEIVFDKDRITQVVVNLINNAIKFTDSGGFINVELTGDGEHAVIRIRDTGIGISKEDQKRLFRPFVQVDSSYGRKYEGSGLGLAICKGIITYHGGKIWIESEAGKGSTFIFTISYKNDVKDKKIKLNLLEQ